MIVTPNLRQIVSLSVIIAQLIDMKQNTGHPSKMIGGPQIKAARGLLGWSAETLADHAKIGRATVQRAETSLVPPITVANLLAIQRALEAAGVIFIDRDRSSGGGGPGVRLKD